MTALCRVVKKHIKLRLFIVNIIVLIAVCRYLFKYIKHKIAPSTVERTHPYLTALSREQRHGSQYSTGSNNNSRRSNGASGFVSTLATRTLVFWSSDYHAGPIRDLKHLLESLGVRFIDKSLVGRCQHTDTARPCPVNHRDINLRQTQLRVINYRTAMNLNDPSLIRHFVDAYRDDPEINSVDAFVCFHPTSLCELYESFNKTLIVIASTRYELGRHNPDRWIRWNANVLRYSTDRRQTGDVIGANNRYDAEYIRYFTGAEVTLLPSYCGYVLDELLKEGRNGRRYFPSRSGFILAPIHNARFSELFTEELRNVWCERKLDTEAGKDNCSTTVNELLFPLRSKYPRYNYSDLASHRGIVYVPYQVSVMSLFEQYRINIPLFFPSIDLLTRWQYKHMVMNERTWEGYYGKRPSRSVIPAHSSQQHLPDPNNEQNPDAIRYWIKYSDFYEMPHIKYYDSVDHLVTLLTSITDDELIRVSQRMKTHSDIVKEQLNRKWKEILDSIIQRSSKSSSVSPT